VIRTAEFDQSGAYRYHLGRAWDGGGRRAAFVLLNPSRADAERDDPTIRRCIAFARAWGFGGLDVVNLFAWRCPRPRDLRAAADPVGPGNDRRLLRTARAADLVVAGWGNAGSWLGRDRTVGALLGGLGPVHCLGLTKQGRPRHPLYVPGAVRPRPYGPPVPQ
jgi:hypothetical protein